MIEVVSALIVHPNSKLIFLQKRGPNALRSDLWETPGGKVEPAETPASALSRELDEELLVEVPERSIGPLVGVWECHLSYSFRVSLLHVELLWDYGVFAVLVPEREDLERCRVNAITRMWVDLDLAVEHLPCVPSLYALYQSIKAFMDPARCRCNDVPKPRICRAHNFVVKPGECWHCGRPSVDDVVDAHGRPNCGAC
jgi:8-oxo-dGTP pyrophosphatase MutT (NUDIX family)